MRVVETAVAASCAIMSEDKNLNGSDIGSSSRKSADLSHSPISSETGESSISTGGRLKFFKDGKLILELSNRKEGERESWIPVQKKNLWHPAAVANSTASLSASDDTSSVQLSPWQRDHCWKQSVPRRLRSNAGCTFYMMPRTAAVHARSIHGTQLRKLRRRPYEAINLTPILPTNGHQHGRLRIKLKNGSSTRLATIVQRLWELVKFSPNAFSPRKRILRDLERVCVVADEPVKRQRPPRPGNSKSGVSSYSITSLLGPRDDESSYLRNLLHSPSPKTTTTTTSTCTNANTAETFSSNSTTQSPYVYYPFQQSTASTQPPYYMTSPPSHSLWTPYPMSSLPRGGAGGPYAGLVPPYSSSPFSYPWSSPQGCQLKRDDTSSDVPLNLSKHGNG